MGIPRNVSEAQVHQAVLDIKAAGQVPLPRDLAKQFGVSKVWMTRHLREYTWWTAQDSRNAALEGSRRAHARLAEMCAQGYKVNAHRKIDPVLRFWPKVDKSGDCWVWTGSRDAKGYGMFALNGKAIRTSRFSWMLAHGSIPDGLHVLHKCDNPPCVNPSHLFLGTNADNMRDRANKGHYQYQKDPLTKPHRKLTPDQVREIRRLYPLGKYTQKQLGKMFGISRIQVQYILYRKAWVDLPDDIPA